MARLRIESWVVVLAVVAVSGTWSSALARTEGVIFMEAVLDVEKKPIEKGGIPVYRQVVDPTRLAEARTFLQNESTRLGLRLWQAAARVLKTQAHGATAFIVLEEDGNFGDYGFYLRSDGQEKAFLDRGYVRLHPAADFFEGIAAHEMWHAIHMMMWRSKIPHARFEPLFHSNSVITGRLTAFDEGLAISLETLVAHRSVQGPVYDKFRHVVAWKAESKSLPRELFFPALDCLTIAQSFDRYTAVRDNHFAFDNACVRKTYQANQLDKSRDFGALKNAARMLASEGFVASFLFRLADVQLSADLNNAEVVYRKIFEAIQVAVTGAKAEPVPAAAPILIYFLNAYAADDPGLRRMVFEILFDLSKGAFFISDAQERWRSFYRGSLAIDLAGAKKAIDVYKEKRELAIAQALADREYLSKRIAPTLFAKARNAEVSISITDRKKDIPFVFEVNSVSACSLIKGLGLSLRQVESFIAERKKRGFSTWSDVQRRVPSIAALIEPREAKLPFNPNQPF